jgi:hypothetical protein
MDVWSGDSRDCNELKCTISGAPDAPYLKVFKIFP